MILETKFDVGNSGETRNNDADGKGHQLSTLLQQSLEQFVALGAPAVKYSNILFCHYTFYFL